MVNAVGEIWRVSPLRNGENRRVFIRPWLSSTSMMAISSHLICNGENRRAFQIYDSLACGVGEN
jgi:hypothetical protein